MNTTSVVDDFAVEQVKSLLDQPVDDRRDGENDSSTFSRGNAADVSDQSAQHCERLHLYAANRLMVQNAEPSSQGDESHIMQNPNILLPKRQDTGESDISYCANIYIKELIYRCSPPMNEASHDVVQQPGNHP